MSAKLYLENFEEIYNDTYDRTLRYIITKCSNIDDVNDLLQDTYVEFYKLLQKKKYIELDNCQNYIIGIAKKKIYKQLLSYKIPCLVFTTEIFPDEELLKQANETDTPVFSTEQKTSPFQAELIRWLNVELAPCISIHGVLVDVYGVGVLIMGESGIGKSEAALELIKRGHRLVTDDVVEIRRVSDHTLVGSAPDITKHLIELRGIGIVDVKTLFGVQSVRETQAIDLVITLEDWNKEKEYDRLGLEEEYTEFLGNKVVCHSIPIRPGRNLAIIVESASVNHRQKQMGYNAAQELYRRVQESLTRK